jgi:hypothetical protein
MAAVVDGVATVTVEDLAAAASSCVAFAAATGTAGAATGAAGFSGMEML